MGYKRKYSGARGNPRKRSNFGSRAAKPRKRGGLVKVMRSIALRVCETKYTEKALQDINLYHNGGTAPNLMQINELLEGPAIGTGTNQRNGDEVVGVRCELKLWLSHKLDRPNVMWRILVYSCPASTAAGSADLFDATGSTNRMIAYVNKEKYRVLYDKLLQPPAGDYSLESGATLKERSRLVKINLPQKMKKIVYVTGSGVPKYDRNHLRVAVIPYDAFGTLVSDNIASFAYNLRFYFKDP